MFNRTFVSAAFVTALAGVAPAEAATVRLHVQAPYDIANVTGTASVTFHYSITEGNP